MTKILHAYLWHGSGVTMTSWDKSRLTLATAWDWDKFLVSILCLVVTWVDLFLVVSFDLIQWRIQGRAPLIFRPKWRPKGRKTFFWRPPPPPYLRVWMTRPPPPPPRPLSDGLDPPLWLKSWRTGNATQHPEDNRTDFLELLWLVNINSEDKWGTTGTSQSDPFNKDLWSIT